MRRRRADRRRHALRASALGAGATVLWLLPLPAASAGPEAPGAEGADRLAVHVGEIDVLPTGPSVAERLVEIRRRIQRAVVYPPLARRDGVEGVAQVRFEIDRGDGRARGIELDRSSGHYLLDRAAEESVRRAGTLPWVYGSLVVPIHFELTR